MFTVLWYKMFIIFIVFILKWYIWLHIAAAETNYNLFQGLYFFIISISMIKMKTNIYVCCQYKNISFYTTSYQT